MSQVNHLCHYRLHGGLSSHAHSGRRLPPIAVYCIESTISVRRNFTFAGIGRPG
jgi:hypothetical protein